MEPEHASTSDARLTQACSADVRRCFWCNADPVESAKHHEGPHATWCFHFRESQRGGVTPTTV